MNKSNSFIASISLTCVAINIGLFLFAVLTYQNDLQLLTLFNVACFSLYFIIMDIK
jgi:hypothetical protein